MNKVFHSQLRKAYGIMHFSASEKKALSTSAAASAVASTTTHIVVGLCLFTAAAVFVMVHRRLSHNRLDHLELLLRTPPQWNLCERDKTYTRS